MQFKFFGILAAVALVAACETAPESTGGSETTGASSTTSASTNSGVQTSTIRMGSQEDLVVNVGDRVFFGTDRYDLGAEARAALDKQAAWLKKFPAVRITIEGHADERGTREYNLALGDRRAASAKDYLVALGVNPARISTIFIR